MDYSTVIIYTYYQSKSSDYNLDFYCKTELIENANKEGRDYIIVINGYTYNKSIPIPNAPNITLLLRENTGYDFGGHNAALIHLDTIGKKYDYYFFMNSGVCGPMIDLEHCHWSKLFINKINNRVKLVGTTIVCLPHEDAGGYGPKIEGFFFMTDVVGLRILREKGTIFCSHPTKYSAIVNGEYGLSNCMLGAGYSIDCMLKKYEGINWQDTSNYNKNNNRHPSRKGSFYGDSINPYEVIFHKWYWHGEPLVNFEIVNEYVMRRQNIGIVSD
jgi:hypothetical protein